MILLTVALAAPSALDAAYQREYAYLMAERAALQAQSNTLASTREERLRNAQDALASVQAQVLATAARRDQVEDQLFDLSRAHENRGLAEDRVDGILVRAEASLPGFAVPQGDSPAAQAAALEASFTEALRVLGDGGGVTNTPGSWFAVDGTKTTGTLTRIGRIAAFGDGAPLAPAGEGRLVALGEGEGVYLFEGENKRAIPEPDKTWMDQLRAGGIIGAIILAIGFLGAFLALVRLATLAVVRRPSLTQVVAAVKTAPFSREDMEDRAAEVISRQTPKIQRFGAAILVIAAVAPLLGLLGTVTGMISTFEVLTTHGTGDPRMLSGGISEALVTTQLGLIVAIPMLLIGNLLDRAGSNLLGRMETEALAAMNLRDGPDPEHRLAAK